MKWSDDCIQETKNIFKRHYQVELTTEEAIENLDNLIAYAKLLNEIYEEQKARGIDILASSE